MKGADRWWPYTTMRRTCSCAVDRIGLVTGFGTGDLSTPVAPQVVG